MSRNRNIAGVVDLLNGGIRATMALIKRMWNSHRFAAIGHDSDLVNEAIPDHEAVELWPS